MIAFNFNIVFSAEPLLQDNEFNSALATIRVLPAEGSLLQKPMGVSSDWFDMSGRKVKYWAQREFPLATISACQWAVEIEGVLTQYWLIGSDDIHYQPKAQFTPERLRFFLALSYLVTVKICTGKAL